MKLIGLEDCPGCKIIKEAHPEVDYIEVPRIGACAKSKELCDIKKLLNTLNLTKFPILMNDELTEVLSLETLDPRLKGYNT